MLKFKNYILTFILKHFCIFVLKEYIKKYYETKIHSN